MGIPVLHYVGQIILNDGPKNSGRRVQVPVIDEPVCVRNQGNGTEGRAVSLRSPFGGVSGCQGSKDDRLRAHTPGIGILREINVKFRLSKSRAVTEEARGARNSLETSLSGRVILDDSLEV